jgi:Ni/Co efflux regulator RcnB
VRYGYYFDDGYAFILRGFFGHNYYWWNYPNWRRPHRAYYVGYPFPDYLYWEEVPYELYYRLPPAPYGCRYVMVDRDVLLISLATGIILDALVYY